MTMKLEKMAEFFEARLEGYDEHMLNDIEGASEFYPFTANALPKDCNILDLGCGTGLELEFYFNDSPNARVTGIDLSQGMLNALEVKLQGKNIKLICASYFDYPFGECLFDAAVSVESLHHFTLDEKAKLYKRLCDSLKDGGFFILTDYFAQDSAYEERCRDEFMRIKRENGISDKAFYHYDTPLTVEHEIQALSQGGFSKVEIMKNWGATYTLKSYK